jgi:hypothetical protein
MNRKNWESEILWKCTWPEVGFFADVATVLAIVFVRFLVPTKLRNRTERPIATWGRFVKLVKFVYRIELSLHLWSFKSLGLEMSLPTDST